MYICYIYFYLHFKQMFKVIISICLLVQRKYPIHKATTTLQSEKYEKHVHSFV